MRNCQRESRLTKLLSTATQALLLTLLLTGFAAAEVVMEYTFDRPTTETVTLGGETFTRVTMPDASNAGAIGQPALPARGASILLPPGTEVSDITITNGERVVLGYGYLLEPVGQPYKLSSPPALLSAPTADPAIYQSAAPFPAEKAESIGVQQFRGYRILTLRLQPVEYLPATGEVAYYRSLTVTVTTADSNQDDADVARPAG